MFHIITGFVDHTHVYFVNHRNHQQGSELSQVQGENVVLHRRLKVAKVANDRMRANLKLEKVYFAPLSTDHLFHAHLVAGSESVNKK